MDHELAQMTSLQQAANYLCTSSGCPANQFQKWSEMVILLPSTFLRPVLNIVCITQQLNVYKSVVEFIYFLRPVEDVTLDGRGS